MEQYHNFLVYFKLEGSDVCFRQFLDYKGVIFAADSLSSANFYARSHKPFEWLKDIKHCSIFATYDLGPVDVVYDLRDYEMRKYAVAFIKKDFITDVSGKVIVIMASTRENAIRLAYKQGSKDFSLLRDISSYEILVNDLGPVEVAIN